MPTTGAGLRTVLYARLSKDRHGEGRSVARQLAELRRLAEREGWNVVAERRDDSIGASKFSPGERAGWQEAFELISTGKADLLAIYSLSRATRDRQVYNALVAACEERGIKLCVGGRYLDPRDPDDAYDLDVKAADAIRQAGTMSKQIRDGHKWSADEGRPHGDHVWYLRRVYDEERSRGRLLRVELIPERAQAVADAAKTVLAGGTLSSAAKKINQSGLDPERKFYGRTLRRLLLSPTLAGLRVHQGKVRGDAMWPPVIDLATHRQLVDLLSEPKRRVADSNAVRHLLPGVALCSICNARMHRVGGTKRPARLTCSATPHLSMRQDPAEEYAHEVMEAVLQRDDVLAAWQPKPPEQIQASENAVQKLADQLAQWEDAAVRGTVTPDAFGRIEAKLRAQIAEAEKAAEQVEIPPVLLRVVTAEDVPAAWQALPVSQQRDVIKLLGAPSILPGRGEPEDRIVFPWEKSKSLLVRNPAEKLD